MADRLRVMAHPVSMAWVSAGHMLTCLVRHGLLDPLFCWTEPDLLDQTLSDRSVYIQPLQCLLTRLPLELCRRLSCDGHSEPKQHAFPQTPDWARVFALAVFAHYLAAYLPLQLSDGLVDYMICKYWSLGACFRCWNDYFCSLWYGLDFLRECEMMISVPANHSRVHPVHLGAVISSVIGLRACESGQAFMLFGLWACEFRLRVHHLAKKLLFMLGLSVHLLSMLGFRACEFCQVCGPRPQLLLIFMTSYCLCESPLFLLHGWLTSPDLSRCVIKLSIRSRLGPSVQKPSLLGRLACEFCQILVSWPLLVLICVMSYGFCRNPYEWFCGPLFPAPPHFNAPSALAILTATACLISISDVWHSVLAQNVHCFSAWPTFLQFDNACLHIDAAGYVLNVWPLGLRVPSGVWTKAPAFAHLRDALRFLREPTTSSSRLAQSATCACDIDGDSLFDLHPQRLVLLTVTACSTFTSHVWQSALVLNVHRLSAWPTFFQSDNACQCNNAAGHVLIIRPLGLRVLSGCRLFAHLRDVLRFLRELTTLPLWPAQSAFCACDIDGDSSFDSHFQRLALSACFE